MWDRTTGRPYYNAIVWQDTRTDRIAAALERDGQGDVIRRKAGLPPATYFSGGKVQWILENVDGVREAAERGDAVFGTTDTWLLWNLTGGADGGVHVTDVTNASRTMLMNLETLDWDDELLGFFNIPRSMLPEIRPSSDPNGYGTTRANGPLGGEVPLTGDLGDQQAATVGQVCFAPGEAKNTYGTGNFMLLNTGTELVRSNTACSPRSATSSATRPSVYALEGSIAVTGSAVQWLRDQLGIIRGAARDRDAGPLGRRQRRRLLRARRSPACSRRTGAPTPAARSSGCPGTTPTRTSPGPPWRRSATRAATSSTRWPRTPGSTLDVLKVDGGITANDLCMQIQADVLGVPVSRPVVAETTALGAAYAAGLAVGFWNNTDELRENWNEDKRWSPSWSDEQRADGYAGWQKAVERTLDWVEVD